MATQQNFAPDRSGIYRFRFDRKLGQGGTGAVYRAIDQKDGEVYAVKIFRANFFRNRLHIRDLAKTAKKASKFQHQNLTHIYEFISGKEGECVVMEYIDGPDLKWYIANRPWNLQERLVIVAQICNGLQYLHEHDFVHHDFKPANCLFTRQGVVKLTDYSLCGTSYLLSLFDPGMHDQVTPMYIAPELIRKEKASAQSDMYSLGVTMYLMFTGRMPFEVDSLQAVYQCHLRVIPDHPCMHNKKCPPALGDIIMRLLEKDPKKRYESFDQLRIILSDVGTQQI